MGVLGSFGPTFKQQVFTEEDKLAGKTLLNNIVREMEYLLDSRQLTELVNNFKSIMEDYTISVIRLDYKRDWRETNQEVIDKFFEAKTLIGLSPRTLTFYRKCIDEFEEYTCKGFESISTYDVKLFMKYKYENGCSWRSVNNIIRCLKSFYGWSYQEGYFIENPLIKIKKVKEPKRVPKPFSKDEIVILRDAFSKKNNLRDKAIFEFLLSTGVRISELTNINKSDIDWNNKSVIVLGKGNKERKVYFNTTTKHDLEKYLKSRKDNNPPLFVSSKKPYNKLGANGVERIVRETGRKCGIEKVHPHRFRRTMATNLLSRGVAMTTIKELLGHEKLETTLIYAQVQDEDLEHTHKIMTN
ncbi:MAG: tyrosine-type recombinase/integrase [Methanobrevibacter sp.]|nr:tyrosine-type recombinase/integrase [Methanobrevibacter sp.]